MLSFFRRGAMAKIALGILFLVLVAMVITGFGTSGGGGIGELASGSLGADTIASVGGEKITTDRLTDVMKRQLERLQQQQPGIDMATLIRRGQFENVADQLIGLTAANVFGEKEGLVATKRMIDAEIVKIPQFQGVTGQFDQNAFRAVLAQQRMTEAQLRAQFRDGLLQRQLMLPAVGSPFVPQGFANQYAALLLEGRSGMVGAVPTKAMGPGTEPNDSDVTGWYKQNIARYTVPERRVIRYAVIGAETVAAQSKPSDAEIEAAYARNPAYAATETRTLSQVVLPSQQAANAFAQKVASGTPFAQAAQQAGYSASDIAVGEKTQADYARISSPQVAAAVFAAKNGAVVGPVRSGFGWNVVKIDAVKAIPAKPLASVRGEIADALQKQKAQGTLNALASRIDNEASSGASFADIAKKENLTIVQTPPVTANGQAPDVPAGWTVPTDLAPLLHGAFQTDPNDPPAVAPIVPNQRYALVSVAQVVPAAAPPLAQIKDRVKTDLMAWRASLRAKAVAQSIVSKINAGVPAAQAFAQAGVKLPPLQPLSATRRDLSKPGQQVPPALTALFTLSRGKARMIDAGEARGWFIVTLDKVIPGDVGKEPALTQAVRSQFQQILGDEYQQQFTNEIRAGVKVKRNDQALAKLKTDLLAGAGGQ
ncbi:MAG TPA: SurA N-terminal domain-containing protein [Allosphingosinicella sp.]|jgi:peptidyl-prolyl cis-trans isomerase D|nr:SurA N-terminal domain-containing protein [Allosphingosinicella sp.]